jgi:hypothetical protein
MHLLRAITVALGWLSGALAGLGALLYACGYLITRAQLHLFGVSGFFPLSADHFMQEGARFFVVIGNKVIETLLAVVAFGLVVTVVVLVAWAACRQWRPDTPSRLAAGLTGVHASAERLHRRLVPWSPAISVYLLLLAVLVVQLESYRERFTSPLEVSDVLYATAAPDAADATRRHVQQWMLAGDRLRLGAYFTDLLDAEIRAALLLLVAWYVTLSLSRRVLLLAPFVITLVLYTLYLPMVYGVLVRPTSYNEVALHFRVGHDASTSGRLFLLSSTDNEFVVWDATLRTVLWIPKTEVLRAEVRRVESLFVRRGATP